MVNGDVVLNTEAVGASPPNNTVTLPLLKFVATRSTLPSPFKSAAVTDMGLFAVGYCDSDRACWLRNPLDDPSPSTVVIVLLPKSAVATSREPSSFKSSSTTV